MPVLAAVNGPALGGGLDLALACDLRIATPEARFASSWVRMGLVPATGGAHALPRIVGAGRAAELLLLGRTIGADVALAWGLVSEVVEAPELASRIDAIAAEVAALPEAAVRLTKATFRREARRRPRRRTGHPRRPAGRAAHQRGVPGVGGPLRQARQPLKLRASRVPERQEGLAGPVAGLLTGRTVDRSAGSR